MASPEPFESILDAARAGGEWAWARLVREIDGPLRGYVRRQGAVDVDDLVGETWLHVARGIHRFSGDESSFRSWVFMIAHHRLIDERRRRGRRPSTSVGQSELDAAGGSHPSAEAVVMDDAGADGVLAVLDELSEDQREVVLLRVLGGFGVIETAEIIGKSVGATQALQHRAFKRLRKILG